MRPLGLWLWAGMAGCGSTRVQLPDPDPTEVVRLWQAALVEGRVDDAYALVHPSARRGLDLDGFRELYRRHREALLERAAELVELARASGPTVTARVAVDGFDVELQKTDEGWRLTRPVGARAELASKPGGSDVVADVVKEMEVPAAMDDVWAAWTTAAGARTFFAPEARIEAVPGGAYELYFALELPIGQRGSEGCQVLAIDPPRQLVFSWNFPPSLPSVRDERTQVQIELSPTGPQRTRVRLVQTGWRQGEDWAAGRAYFDRAWGMVLERLARRFAQGPVDWSTL